VESRVDGPSVGGGRHWSSGNSEVTLSRKSSSRVLACSVWSPTGASQYSDFGDVATSRVPVYVERKIGTFGSTPEKKALRSCRKTLTSASAATLKEYHRRLCGWMSARPEPKLSKLL